MKKNSLWKKVGLPLAFVGMLGLPGCMSTNKMQKPIPVEEEYVREGEYAVDTLIKPMLQAYLGVSLERISRNGKRKLKITPKYTAQEFQALLGEIDVDGDKKVTQEDYNKWMRTK